ncbi:MAG: hypothetical protein HYU53_06330 [Acidobacteria bacterium]|nr:hypothetical protein [Acidobacteriota bacterium]
MRKVSRARRWEAGYTLVEMLISTAIMVAVTGSIFSLVNPAQGTSRIQPEAADMQQRARIGAEMLYRDLVMAGAGPYQGSATGSLATYFAPILPRRLGKISPDASTVYKDNTLTIVYVPNTASQTTIRTDMPLTSSELKVNPQVGCPVASPPDPLCGFTEGESVLVFDPSTGGFDTFVITRVQEDSLMLQHRGQTLSQVYGNNSAVTEAQYHTYYHDAAANRLMHYDGVDTDVPVLDNVVDLKFEYWGDPNPPKAPVPSPSTGTNCVMSAGVPRLATLAATTGSLVRLSSSILTDGAPAWCGTGTNQFDPDLFRVRKVSVLLRVQASDSSMRGPAGTFFRRAGAGAGPGGWIPDYEVKFDVTPRNLNLGR